jgi:hypothetical protein
MVGSLEDHQAMLAQYLHINYVPEDGWVLSIMGRLLNSSNPRLRKAFNEWSDTPLKELGFAITTRIHMLGRCVRRLNGYVAELREQINQDDEQVHLCLAKGYAFRLPNENCLTNCCWTWTRSSLRPGLYTK